MKKVFTLSALVLFLLGCKEHQEVHNEPQIETKLSVEEVKKTILDLEKDALNGWAEGSVYNYTKNFADDVIYIDDIAAQDGIQGIEAVQTYAKSIDSTGMITKHKYELDKVNIQVFDKRAIIFLHYLSFSMEGEPTTPWKASVLYEQREDTWKVIHANWSFLRRPLN